MEDCSCKVALVLMINRFWTAHKDWCRVLCRGLLLGRLEDRLVAIWSLMVESEADAESGGELEVDRDAVKARVYIDAGLVQGSMEYRSVLLVGREEEKQCHQSFVCKLVPCSTNPVNCFDLLRSDSRSSSDVSASKMRHRYLLRPTPVVKQPPPMPHGYGQRINGLAIFSSPSRTTSVLTNSNPGPNKRRNPL